MDMSLFRCSLHWAGLGLLSQLPKCWNYRSVPPCPASEALFCFINVSKITLTWREIFEYSITIVTNFTNFSLYVRFLKWRCPPCNVPLSPREAQRQGCCRAAALSLKRSQLQVGKNNQTTKQNHPAASTIWKESKRMWNKTSWFQYTSLRIPGNLSRTIK
jgi:hypothetical protein